MFEILNRALHERKLETQFCSMIFALWDGKKREIGIVNSGSPRPIFCRRGEISVVQATGIPLGMFAAPEYEDVNIAVEAGDVLVIFSDGMVDALNADEDMFGRRRLEEIVAESTSADCGRDC